MAKMKGGLGKGLDALFADNGAEESSSSTLSISEIEPNKEQPRKDFDTAALGDLADSIREYGILQPLVVRPMPDGGYQLVAGERRWRAARMAGLTEVPVVIKELTDQQAMELALVENLQREDLNPIEEARGYQELMEKFEMTQEQVSARVGKSRPVITNALRLLKLPQEVQELLSIGKLSNGHARALLALEDEELILQIAREIVRKGLSVRQVESLVKRVKQAGKPEKPKATAWDNPYFSEVQLALSESLSRKVLVEGKGEKGRLVIEFYGQEDLKTIVDLLGQDSH